MSDANKVAPLALPRVCVIDGGGSRNMALVAALLHSGIEVVDAAPEILKITESFDLNLSGPSLRSLTPPTHGPQRKGRSGKVRRW